MRAAPTLALPMLLLAAGCGAEHLQASGPGPASAPMTGGAHGAVATHTDTSTTTKTASGVQQTGTAPASMCRTSGLSLRLGRPGYAAGSRYVPIAFTNTTKAMCTLTGYPGVSFVAPGTGHQVGAAAVRNRQHATTTVALAPGRSASALLQIVNHANYSPAECKATPVSGLRVYPPGNTAAAYLPFGDSTQSACSSQVEQLAVDAVVAGSSG
jgi:hypothetical protein